MSLRIKVAMICLSIMMALGGGFLTWFSFQTSGYYETIDNAPFRVFDPQTRDQLNAYMDEVKELRGLKYWLVRNSALLDFEKGLARGYAGEYKEAVIRLTKIFSQTEEQNLIVDRKDTT